MNVYPAFGAQTFSEPPPRVAGEPLPWHGLLADAAAVRDMVNIRWRARGGLLAMVWRSLYRVGRMARG